MFRARIFRDEDIQGRESSCIVRTGLRSYILHTITINSTHSIHSVHSIYSLVHMIIANLNQGTGPALVAAPIAVIIVRESILNI